MAAITTAGSGNWSSTTPNAPWPSGTVPTASDAVTIASGHTVTLDTTGCVCSTLTINDGGTWAGHRSNNISLTVQTTITAAVNSVLDFGAVGDEVMGSCVITLNNAQAAWQANCFIQTNQSSAQTCNWSFFGDPSRERIAHLASSASSGQPTITLTTSAHGWVANDRIVIQDTTNTNADNYSYQTILSVSGANITFTTNLTSAHAAGARCGNLTSNLKITAASYATNKGAGIRLNLADYNANSGTSHYAQFRDVEFYGLGEAGSGRYPIYIYTNVPASYFDAGFTDCSFDCANFTFINVQQSLPITDCVGYSSLISGMTIFGFGNASLSGGLYFAGNGIFSANYSSLLNRVENSVFNIIANGSCVTGGGEYTGVEICGYANTISNNGDIATLSNCNISAYINTALINVSTLKRFGQYTITNNLLSATASAKPFSSVSSMQSMLPASFVEFIDKDGDVTSQEIHAGYGITKRDNATSYRSVSSISLLPIRVGLVLTREQSIPCANNASIRIVGYVQFDTAFYNSNDYTAPTVTISGLGITPVVYTATSAANGAWEQFDLTATNNVAGYDGNFTLTYSATAKTVTTGTVYFDGVPNSPFVTKCRHYGFTINESSPTRTADPYTVASESTAAAYTGVTINNTTKEISFAAGTADTAQKFYDFHQATICDNLDYDVAISRAGTLFSLLSTWTVIDPYYSGDLTWSGGTVQYSTYGTLADNLDGCIVEFADTGGGTYTLTGTLSGTLDLRNLDSDPITVEVPTGTTTTDANNTGGAITVQEPQVYQSVTLTGGEAGSRVQLYDVTSSTELYNDVPGSWPFTWTDPTPYVADREIRLRVMWVSGADAKQFIDQTIGTVTDVSPALPYLVSQLDDTVYIANGIDGSALTGYAIVGTNLRIDVDDGTATWAEMYAYQVYWLSTEDGIRDQDLFIFGIDTANYLFYGGFKIRNTSSPSVPLLITGGNGEPSSGPATDLLDTTGGTIFVNSAIVVPYSSGAAVTEQIVRDGLTSQGYTTTRANAIDTIPEDVWSHNLP